ncbi:hypothetical protein [uncultured Jatrophihabitans sp.]|uniref:hypothetical protein n=1 Tax=uncultured Jatrophihabitans sp. TaxID=1610747 RepID=UPI0035CB221F
MYRKVLITGVTAAAIIGAGGTALAVTGSDSPSTPAKPSSSSGSSAKHDHDGKKGKHGKHGLLRRLEHGQFVSRGKDGKTVTHDLISGTVTAVSPSSITVQSADKKSETFAVTKDTKIRVRDNGKGAESTINKVAKGDRAVVAGTGTSKYTALHVVDVKGAKKTK